MPTQKTIIGIMAGVQESVSCRKLCGYFNMLTLPSESVLFLFGKLGEKCKINSDVCSLNTVYKCDLHMPNSDLSKYQK